MSSVLSSDIQEGTKKAIADKTAELEEMRRLVDEAEAVLTDKDRDLSEFGGLLDHTWRLKRGISGGISTDIIDDMYETAKKAGAIGGKLLGAGGGGFLLFYVEKDRRAELMEAMKELLYIPFEFENGGSTVIHYSPESYEPRLKNA